MCWWENSGKFMLPVYWGVISSAVQMDLDRLERLACAILTKFSKASWKVLRVGQGNPKHKMQDG